MSPVHRALNVVFTSLIIGFGFAVILSLACAPILVHYHQPPAAKQMKH